MIVMKMNNYINSTAAALMHSSSHQGCPPMFPTCEKLSLLWNLWFTAVAYSWRPQTCHTRYSWLSCRMWMTDRLGAMRTVA